MTTETKKLDEAICAEVVGCSGSYTYFHQAYSRVARCLDDYGICLDETDYDQRMEVYGCDIAAGSIDFAFSRYSTIDCNDLVSFEWFTSRLGIVNCKVRIVQEGL